MFAMCTDNIFWISSSPEYNDFKKLNWFKQSKPIKSVKGNKTKISYILNYRIKSVLTDLRDIIPGIMTSLIMALMK